MLELSPFNVEASDSSGYTATSTLAGTRIKTSLKDLGSAIAVITKEFMEDIGATDSNELLSYTLNTEVGGKQGNFSGAGDADDGCSFSPDSRADPQFNQWVRGLGHAELPRGYFLTDIPLDSYNTDRVTVGRGPNSMLFGIGSPGGVVNTSLKQAHIGVNFAEVSARVGSFGSYRADFDLNRELIEGRLALRLAAISYKQGYRQEEAYERQERLYFGRGAVENQNNDVLDEARLKVTWNG